LRTTTTITTKITDEAHNSPPPPKPKKTKMSINVTKVQYIRKNFALYLEDKDEDREEKKQKKITKEWKL